MGAEPRQKREEREVLPVEASPITTLFISVTPAMVVGWLRQGEGEGGEKEELDKVIRVGFGLLGTVKCRANYGEGGREEFGSQGRDFTYDLTN